MSAIFPSLKLLYISIPKCACTSLKSYMYLIENGEQFEGYKNNGKVINIHHLYPSNSFKKMLKIYQKEYDLNDYTKICLIRDPIQRIISAYTNRVKHHKELSEKILNKYDLNPNLANPTFGKFLDNYFVYRKVHSIKHHTDPLHEFIGENPAFYDKIFNLNKINDFSEFINEKFNMEYKIPKLQTGGGGVKSINIEEFKKNRPNTYKKLEKITAKDYEIFSSFL